MNDLKFACRQLLKHPGFTAVAVLTLGICIGANLSIFAVVDAILVRALPHPEAGRLVTLYNDYPKAKIARDGASLTSYFERRGQIPAFSQIASIWQTASTIGEAGSTSRENIGRVTPEFFNLLGADPVLGRAFANEELTYQTGDVVILSHEYWRDHYRADTGVVGQTIRIDSIPRLIVGVLPPGFQFLSFAAPIYMPLASEENERSVESRHSLGKVQIARLAPGATLEQAQAQVSAHDQAIAAGFPEASIVEEAGFRTVVTPLHTDHVASVRPVLVLLQSGGILLLLIGAVNLVNLLLIRASARARELGIRQSLGARRGHVIRLVLSETVLLALAGGFLGLAVGAAGVRSLAVLGVEQLPLGARVVFDERLALVSLMGAVLLGILIAGPVAWLSLRSHLAETLRSESRGGTTHLAAQRLRHGFIVAQVSLAFVMLTGAGLLGVSLRRVLDVSPGFRTDHLIAGRFSLPWNNYRDDTSFRTFGNRLMEELNRLPGVEAAGFGTRIPLTGISDQDTVTVPGHAAEPGGPVVVHAMACVGGEYFSAMGIPLKSGRFLEMADSHREDPTCVVDEDFARRYWPDGDALGKQVYRGTIAEGETPYRVVGVVGSVKTTALTDSENSGVIYFPYLHYFARDFYLVARTSGSPETLAGALQQLVRRVDAEMPLSDVRSMDVRVADGLVARRSPALLTGVFAGVALLLAAVGTFGALAYAVSQRRREIGVRLALGALPQQIRHQFLNIGLRLLAAGISVGVLGALLTGRIMKSMLFDTPPVHLPTLVLAALVLGAVTVVACLLPSHRASRVDPMEALRAE